MCHTKSNYEDYYYASGYGPNYIYNFNNTKTNENRS